MKKTPAAGQGEPVPSPTQPASAATDTPWLAAVWGHIKQHKVVQWTLAYAAVAYTLLHGVEMLSEAQEWPHVIVRLFSLLLIAGVPVVATLAWYHGAKGLQRVSGAELTIITLLGIIAGSILWSMERGSAERSVAPADLAAAAAPVSAAAPRTSIAVMPFANLTGDPSKDYLGDGMAEELINTLTRVPGLRVPARTSTFSYKGRNTDAKQIAKDLNVGTILEGSVRSAGTTIRITAQLIDTRTDSHLWSETYDRKFTDLFKLQDDLATAIVQALQVNLKGASPASITQAPPTQDLEAYQLYLQGSSLSNRMTEQNEKQAIVLFQRAIARDAKFARAYAGISIAYNRLAAGVAVRPFENLAAAERAARQALALDANIASAHVALANVASNRGNWMEAEVHAAASIALGGNDGYVHGYRGIQLGRVGRFRDALAEGRKGFELAPADPWVVANLAGRYSNAGSYAEAWKYADLAVQLGHPKDGTPLPALYAEAALREGRYADSADILIRPLDLSDPERARQAQVIKLVHAALADPRRRASTLAALAQLYDARPSAAALTDITPCMVGAYRFVLLNAVDKSYALANQCLNRMAPGAAGRFGGGLWNPWMRPFRQDPRFQAFTSRLGLMAYWQRYGPPDDCDLKNGKLTCH